VSTPAQAGCLLVALGLAALVGCTGDGDGEQPSPPTEDVATGCADAVRRAPLPTWAREGFNPPGQTTIHVEGVRGDLVGVLFGYPLTSPPPHDRQNKILWVSRVGSDGGPLTIRAHLMGSDLTAVRHLHGGPGPSVVDMPAPGCWEFDLAWSESTDQVYVRYRPR
jgi:hypothetical protein